VKRVLLLFALAFGSYEFVALEAQTEASDETIHIDPNGASHPFPHFWEKMFGSGRANLSMRASYRRDLREVKDKTGFTYIRFHAILDDENGVYSEDPQGSPVYNFSYVDQIYDGLLSDHVKPFVEIGFMPLKLAANPKPHPFWYRPIPSPPSNFEKWNALIRSFAQHLITRYGKSEVDSWYFEVWNEPNIDFWDGVPKQETYFAFYDQTARTLKEVDPQLRVGGPATAQAAWVDAFIAHCTKTGVPFDFVSTHVYGNDTSQDVFGRQLQIPRRDMVARAAKKVFDQVKASAAPNTPIIWSEYNATYMNQVEVTDSPFMGPWIANNIRESDGLSSMTSYWCFSDVFEEQGVVKTPFYGGYGLIAERHIPKSAFWAFQMLHNLGTTRLLVDSENALVTKRPDGVLVLALWNYAEPGQSVPNKVFHLAAQGSIAKTYRLQMIDENQGSGLKAWQDIGAPVSPTPEQVDAIRRASMPKPPQEEAISTPVTVPRYGLALVEIEPGR
jgi:xylan 1,4-beta-xylosidase